MSPRTAFFALTTTICLIVASLVFAHEGHVHGGAQGNSTDPDAPRSVSPETAATIGLKTVEVNVGPIEEVVQLTGVVKAVPDRHHVIAPRTAGRIIVVHVQAGDRVKSGDVLVEIDSPEQARNIFEARKIEADYQKLLVDSTRALGKIEQLSVELQIAEQATELADAEVKRLESAGQAVSLNLLSEKKSVALQARGLVKFKKVEVDLARKEAEALSNQASALRLSRDALLAVSNIDPQQADIALPGEPSKPGANPDAALNLIRLRSPIEGLVVARTVRPGQGISAGETLLEVADHTQMQIEGEVPESLLPRLVKVPQADVRIRLESQPGDVVAGKVRFISPTIDPNKRTAHVQIIADNPDGYLRAGAYVTLAVILRKTKDAVVVPRSAVLEDGPRVFVYIKDGDVYRKQDIQPGAINDQSVEVLSGLAPGDVVVSQGAYSLTQLRPKAAAKPSAEPAKKPAADGHET